MARDSILVRALGLGTPAPVAAVEEVFAQRWTQVPAPETAENEAPADEDVGAEAGVVEADGAASSELDVIFASIREGEVPWDADDLPENTGAVTALLFELDRVWQNAA
jgi:hypothetical protein